MEAPNLQRRCNHVHPGPLTDEARNRAADGGGSDDRLVVGWYAENALKQKILKSSVDKVLGKGKFTASPFEPTATPVVVSSSISSEKATVEYWRLKRLREQFSGHAIWVRSSILSSSQVSYLCEGFDTPSDEVFFVKEFRDDSLTTKSTREEYARAAILNHLNQSRQSGRNEDVIWTSPPEKDFANKILSGIALYNISGHQGALEAVRHKITNALNDGNLPIEQNENVMAILNCNKYLKNTTFDVERAL
ncbi:hypothetical protein SCAR479_13452 [Seiridium cardinale]|uniref:Uncharacterized protein n=1 Tax=Seiridium cardinale TaxID=138064 RepID=A0ABR2X832_9PEZI